MHAISNNKNMAARRAELLEDVAASVARTAREHGVSPATADQIGAAAADELAMDWGGQIITIPRDHYFKLAARDRQVLEEHRNGASIPKLAKHYSMSESGLRKLIRRAERRDVDLRQTQLFQETP